MMQIWSRDDIKAFLKKIFHEYCRSEYIIPFLNKSINLQGDNLKKLVLFDVIFNSVSTNFSFIGT